MFNKSKCYNGGDQHCFEPRYDELCNSSIKFDEIEWYKLRQLLDSSCAARDLIYYNIYIKDVCVWCGKEIKK